MPVNVLCCAGSNWNTVGRAGATSSGQVTTSDNNSLFPPSYLYDYLASQAFRFSTTSSGTISVDCNLLLNGSMETAATSAAGVLASWIVSVGTVTQSSSQQSRGTYSMKLSGAAAAYKDVTVRADERFTLTAALFGDATSSGLVRVQAQNLQTFNYLTSSGGWQTAQTYCMTSTAAAWTTKAVTGNIESFNFSVFNDTMTVRVTPSNAGSTVYVDDVYYWPSTTLVSMHGFLNIDPGVVVTVISSTDGFTTQTTNSTLTHYVPSMFYTTTSSPIDMRYVRINFAGVNSTGTGPIYGGELVLSQPTVITRNPDPSVPSEWTDAQARPMTILGEQRAYRLSSHPTRTVTLPYSFTTLAEYRQVRDLVRRSGMGATPVVLIPSSTDPETCVMGRIEERWIAIAGPMVQFWSGSKLLVSEFPFPAWVS